MLLEKLLGLLVAFGRVGVLGYGGGPSMIPLVEYEVVNNYGWMTQEEFSEVLAVGYALPGPIATKMAGYIGFKVAGWAGAAAALAGVVAPTVLVMAGLFVLVNKYRHSPLVIGITRGVTPVVLVLLALLVYDTARSSFAAGVHPLAVGALVAASFVLLQVFHLHPAWVVAAAIVVGAVFLKPV